MNDELLFPNDDTSAEPIQTINEYWNILIVDDEPEIHKITKLALNDYSFEGKGIKFHHAYNSKEALSIVQNTPDIALTLLDVVMESNHAGLNLIPKIRKELNNNSIRIVLRTGQPGMAPEHDIITNYDINDYVEKTELSAQKLFTLVTASLRAYRDIIKLEDNQKKLRLVNNDLYEQRERIQVTLDSIGDAVMTTDEAGKITHLNPVAESLTGWDLQSAKGMDIKNIFPIVDASTRSPIENPVEKVIKTGETVFLSNHTTLISKSGDEYQIADSAAPIRNTANDILGMVLVFNDVTEQYALREETKKAKKNLQTIMDNTPAVIYAKDTQGKYIFINKKFEQLFNTINSNIIGKTDFDIFPEEFAQKLYNNDNAVIKSSTPIESEEEIPIGDKTHHYLSVKFPLLDENNDVYAVCGISTNITERKKQEEQLRQSQKMDALGKLTSGVAHDYNNMLTIALGYAELLQKETTDQPTCQDYTKQIIHTCIRATDLTRKLLAYSKKSSNGKEIININKMLSQEKDILEKTLTASIKVKLELDEKAAPITVNPSDLEDAIINISINAMHAMEGTGKLTITTQPRHIYDDEASSLDIPAGEYTTISIRDTGCGIEEEQLKYVFDPFFTTKGALGTGLGLSQVHGFVTQSNGLVKIYSEVGRGSEVTMYFPSAENNHKHHADIQHKDTDLKQLHGNETILVVDDEPVLRQLTTRILEASGYNIYTAESGLNALQLLKLQKIDLVLTDIIMPGMNGYELAKILRQDFPGIPLLMASGFHDPRLKEQSGIEEDIEILQKPYDHHKLLTYIRNKLDNE